MAYIMRRKDGTADAASTLAVIERDGKLRHLVSDAFQMEVLGTWRSPRNGAEYPIRVRIRFEDESFELKPLAEGQEHDGGITRLPYWEGACDVIDSSGQVAGRAFLELAGYAGDLTDHPSADEERATVQQPERLLARTARRVPAHVKRFDRRCHGRYGFASVQQP